jgi:hypothetical protein
MVIYQIDMVILDIDVGYGLLMGDDSIDAGSLSLCLDDVPQRQRVDRANAHQR